VNVTNFLGLVVVAIVYAVWGRQIILTTRAFPETNGPGLIRSKRLLARVAFSLWGFNVLVALVCLFWGPLVSAWALGIVGGITWLMIRRVRKAPNDVSALDGIRVDVRPRRWPDSGAGVS
jgi:hypothetical protein